MTTTIAYNGTASVYCPLDGGVTITPDGRGPVKWWVTDRTGTNTVNGQSKTSATVSVSAGSTLSIQCFECGATYTDPSGFTPVAYTDLATTTGVLGQSYQIVGGDDDGARLIWTTSAADTVPSWRWWAWPDSTYL